MKQMELRYGPEERLSGTERPSRLIRAAQDLGLLNHRNMVWAWEPGNFGDWIGPLIYARRRGRPPLHYRFKRQWFGEAYITAGSIMRYIKTPDRAVVWGTGIISRADFFERPKAIHAVRGPLTRERCRDLGYSCPEVYGDPGILLPEVLGTPKVEITHRVGVIPHYVHFEEASALFAGMPVRIIDVLQPVGDVVRDILSCETTLSSSLHGLVISHSYGRPSAWVTFANPLNGDGVKFHDYYLAGGIAAPPAPARLSGTLDPADLERLAHAAPRPQNERMVEDLLECCPF